MSESIHDPSTVVSQYIALTASSSAEDGTAYAEILASLLSEKKISLLQFIQILGPHITSDSDLIRPRAIQCISDTLSQLSTLDAKLLSKQDLSVLLDFLLVKINDDKACVQYVLLSLNGLCKFDNFYTELLLKLLNKGVLESYNPKKYLAKVRYELFALLETILKRNDIAAASPLFDAYVKSFIHVATGEKDPRNLMISFELNALISKELSFDPEQHKDFLLDLFDVAFCYFPISFTPPANDPYKITAGDLKLKLRMALAGQSQYAGDSFPSLIEKLTSTNPTVRNDVLKTMLACVKSYSVETVGEYWLTIWNALKYEILHNDVSIFKSNEDLIITPGYDSLISDIDEFKPLIITLDIVGELTSKCQDDPVVIDTILSELKPQLALVTDKKFKQAVLLVSMAAASNPISFNKVVDLLFLYEVWGKYIGNATGSTTGTFDGVDVSITIAGQRDLIDNLGFIFNSYNALSFSETFVETNHLINYKDILLIFLGQLLQTSSNLEKTLKCKTIQQLKKLILLPGFLSSSELSLIFGYFNDILIDSMAYEPKSWERDIVVQEVKLALASVMDGTSSNTNRVVELVIESILPTLLNKLPEGDSTTTADVDVSKILTLIGDLCLNYKFLEILSIRLLNKLTVYSQNDSVEYYTATIELLISSIIKTESNHEFLMNSWYKNFVPRFVISIINITSLGSNLESVIEVSGDLLGLIVRYIDKSQHDDILKDFTNFFLNGESEGLLGRAEPVVTLNNSVLINLFNKVLANINKPKTTNFQFGNQSALDLIESDIRVIKTNSSLYVHLGYLKNLSILLNKFFDDNTYFNEYLQNLYQPIADVASSVTVASLSDEFIYDFEIFIWSLKGLIMKTNVIGIDFLNKLISNLSCENEELKKLIAKSLSIIFVDLSLFKAPSTGSTSTKLISGVSSFNVRLLYKQRLFESIIPTLISGFQESSTASRKLSYLIALSNILRNISTKVLTPHLATITPLILTSLSIKDSDILISSLETCQIIITESPDIIIPHLQSLIPRLVEISTYPSSINNLEIRIFALQCLNSIFTKIELQQVVKFQKLTTFKLTKALDDKKRSVRKMACDLRQTLFELGR